MTVASEILAACEAERRAGRRLDLDAAVAAVPEADRPGLLRELVPLDLEARIEAGDPARVEEYVSRFPDLARPPAALLLLLVHEYRVRQDEGEAVRSTEYLARYPDLPDLLDALTQVRRGPLRVPGYEVGNELGRGGMGVVYQALHLRLNRWVALKMILAGRHAGAEECARLRNESQAVARIQHDFVVQVYEAGDCDGLPYLALELCAGSLADRLKQGILPPRAAAALVERVARGVHAVHAAGVVHRDLKPANVLLDKNGLPKVTDFGLARCLDHATHTRTGGLGTPAYMAPEQAEGKQQVGPLADVHALGAILYECLTGRPPFPAKSRLEVLQLVAHAEPLAPRTLNPSIPRDLETICLACLRKEPEKRYASAEALADDLRRWQEGTPIHARPVGTVERAVKWCRRNPSWAALGVVAFLAVVGMTTLWLLEQAARQTAQSERQTAQAETRRATDSLDRTLAAHERLFWIAEREFVTQGKLDPGWKAQLQLAVTAFRGIVVQNPDRPEVRYRNGQALYQIGNTCFLMSEWQEGIDSMRAALILFEGLERDDPNNLDYQVALARTLGLAGWYLLYEQYPDPEANAQEALAKCERAVEVLARVVARDDRADHLDEHAAALYRVACVYRRMKQKEQARAAFTAARRRQQQVLDLAPKDRQQREQLARLCGSMGSYLFHYERDLPAARECLEAGVAAIADLVGTSECDAHDEDEWRQGHELLWLIAQLEGHHLRQALQHFRASLPWPLASLELRLAGGQGVQSLRASLPAAERLARRYPNNARFAAHLAGTLHNVLLYERESAAIIQRATQAIDALRPLQNSTEPLGINPKDLLRNCLTRRAQALAGIGQLGKALLDNAESIPLIVAFPPLGEKSKDEHLLDSYRDRVNWQRTLGRHREAALDAARAAQLAPEAERWRDQLDAATLRLQAGDVVAAHTGALALDQRPELKDIASVDRLIVIYDRHSDQFAENPVVRDRNETRILALLTRLLDLKPALEAAVRADLLERRATRYARERRWGEAVADRQGVLDLLDPQGDPGRMTETRRMLSIALLRANKPAEALQALEPLGKGEAVPENRLLGLAQQCAAIAGHPMLPGPEQGKAALRSLALLETVTARRAPSFLKGHLDFIDRSPIYAPVRKLPGFQAWHDQAAQQAK